MKKTSLIPEHMLDFGVSEEILDPKVGLTKYNPPDYKTRNFKEIKLALLTPKDLKDEAMVFLKNFSHLNESFNNGSSVEFPGFDRAFNCPLILPDGDSIQNFNAPSQVGTAKQTLERFRERVKLNILELKDQKADMIFFRYPSSLEVMKGLRSQSFINHLRVISVEEKIPIKIIADNVIRNKNLDMRDVFWNLSVSVYFKMGGYAWQIKSLSEKPIMFIGLNILNAPGTSRTKQIIAVASVIDECGRILGFVSHNINIENHEMMYSRESITGYSAYHLMADQLNLLIKDATSLFLDRRGVKPMRVIIHKSQHFSEQESKFTEETDQNVSLVRIVQSAVISMIPENGVSPETRGRYWEYERDKSILYTVGYVSAEEGYHGVGSPDPLEVHRISGELPVEKLASEIFGLTRISWSTCWRNVRYPASTSFASTIAKAIRRGVITNGIVKEPHFYY